MSSQERIVDAVLGAVTGVIDVVVAVLERAKGDQSPSAQRPPVVHPIGILKPPGHQGGGATLLPNHGDKAPSATQRSLQAIQDDSGAITVRTGDGYAIKAEGENRGWSITSPAGKTTRISARQEVQESDGGHWRLRGRGTFMFGSSKATVESKALPNGSLIVSRVTVYSGAERVTLAGLDTGRPSVLALAGDGLQHDDGLNDGTLFYRADTTKGESWSVVQNGKRRVMGAK